MRVGIIGAGAAGLLTAWLLEPEHEVTVYDKNGHAGGHAHTLRVVRDGKTVHCEAGFKYFYGDNYPTLMALLRVLGLRPRLSPSSLTVTPRGERALVLPPRQPSHLGSLLGAPERLWDVIRFEWFLRSGEELFRRSDWSVTLADWAKNRGLSPAWAQRFAVPILAACWGASAPQMTTFPAYSALKVMARNRGNSDHFYELEGGVGSYIEALVKQLGSTELRLGAGVRRVTHEAGEIRIEDERGETRAFDHVVLASSARDAARLLGGVPEARAHHELLSRFRHFDARIVIHSDPSFMPARRDDWSLINVFLEDGCAWQTEWSGYQEDAPVFRTWLPAGRERPRDVHHDVTFHHLMVGSENQSLQRRLEAIQGRAGIWTVGMYAHDVDIHESALASTMIPVHALSPRSRNLRRLREVLLPAMAEAS